MHWIEMVRSHPLAHLAANLQSVAALTESESTRSAVMQLQRSLIQLASVEQLLQPRVQWDAVQAQRQQQRLARQQARLRWEHAVMEQLWEKRER